MNLGFDALPDACDVLVVGAGPAGSAAALTLARAGMAVVLVEQQAFPRDKVCGDGLIPDAHQALRELGVLDEVMRHAQAVGHVACIAPRGGRVDVPGELAVLPRKVLDDILCRAAVSAGARMHAPVRFAAPLEEGGVVVGARLQQGDRQHEIRARWVVLATGAVPQALLAAGMAERHTPSGVALRGYIKNDAMVGRIDCLEIVWHRALRPGYGWIFPCGDGVFNIGVGISEIRQSRAGGQPNLRQIYDCFTRVHAPARELVQGGVPIGEIKGAPLRFNLEGARFSRPGLLVCGEAAGSTYSFTGEGIGKALHTGMLAARAVINGQQQGWGDAQVRSNFEGQLNDLKPRFKMYQRANWVNRQPWLADVVVWRAQRSAKIRQRISGLLDETSNPGHLLTAKGVLKLFTE
ncbi:geranylgeranyl reductase family protein [Aquabacterium sp.]|uniref:NAD(P)/FAD-dependent oxidoreductase n=1 Tax=Aquabacterium sp. TaxID=1872578 RepID=UPI002487F969|nr:geranylgeranyl reductase family protein [Aquabacterium sp.]MDI1260581.1 geranylgeranyl reductase family protein [Aquabacterium sp.]